MALKSEARALRRAQIAFDLATRRPFASDQYPDLVSLLELATLLWEFFPFVLRTMLDLVPDTRIIDIDSATFV